MAQGVRHSSNVDIGLATTGIAGPTGGTIDKPVGLVYIAISTHDQIIVKKYVFSGSRLENKHLFCKQALSLLYGLVSKSR
jgi:PncC family amidohydrolase